jgi:hypothetical protein
LQNSKPINAPELAEPSRNVQDQKVRVLEHTEIQFRQQLDAIRLWLAEIRRDPLSNQKTTDEADAE